MRTAPLNPDRPVARRDTQVLLPPPIRSLADMEGSAALFADKPVISLTFDDGPDPRYTPQILNILADYNCKATFFVMGQAAEQFPDLVLRMAREGHSVGNHTYSHRHPWMITSTQALNEVRRTTDILQRITGSAPRWFRPPFGRLRSVMRQEAHREQMLTVLWNHSIVDWGPLGTEAGIMRRLSHIKPKDIVLMHDGKRDHNRPERLIRHLPGFLRSLVEKGVLTCGLDELPSPF